MNIQKAITNIKQTIYSVWECENGDWSVIGTAFRCSERHILTCLHVVRGSNKKQVEIASVRYNLKIIATDVLCDIALLEFPDNATSASHLRMGEYEDAIEGDETILCGFPLGSEYHVTHFGRISAKQRIQGTRGFQIDASINRGNSGGPCIVISNNVPTVVGIVTSRLHDVDYSKLDSVRADLIKLLEVFQKPIKGAGAFGQKIREKILEGDAELAEALLTTIKSVNKLTNVGFGEAVATTRANELIYQAEKQLKGPT